ncbi:MAG: hypothetical protein J6Q42_06090, partial [Clostridia bacterium]|nr:hypothetical protein [Clostridia bacterium]
AKYNDIMYVWDDSNGTYTVRGGAITGGSSSGPGGGINNSDGTLILNGGNIVGNYSSGNGGGVYSKGTFQMNGGAFLANYSESGNGIDIAVQGSDSTATIHNGGVHNTIATAGQAKITIFGGYFGDKAMASIDSYLSEGTGFSENADNSTRYPAMYYPHKVSNGSFILVTSKNSAVSYINDLSTFTTVTNDKAVYKLLKNVPLEHQLIIPANTSVTFDLNGYVLEGNGSNGVIYNNGDLTIIDGNSNAEHKYTVNGDGLYTWNDSTGNVILQGGAITGGINSGGITNKNILTITAGNIVGNYSYSNGGGIFNNGTLTVKAGRIVGNKAGNGGGIFNDDGGTLTIDGGFVADNKATGGSDIYNRKAKLIVNNGGIKGGLSSDEGYVILNGGFYGTNAKNSIVESWLGDTSIWGVNTGFNSLYPTNIYPNVLKPPAILKTERDGKESYVSDINEFINMDTDGATYKLLQNVHLENGVLTVAFDKTVVLDLNGFVLKGSGENRV